VSLLILHHYTHLDLIISTKIATLLIVITTNGIKPLPSLDLHFTFHLNLLGTFALTDFAIMPGSYGCVGFTRKIK